MPLPCTEHQHHPRGLQRRSGAFLVPLSCFPWGCGNPRGVKISSGAQQDPDPRAPGCHSSAYPFPELLLLLGLFSHVQLQKKKRQSSSWKGSHSAKKFSPPQPPQIPLVGREGG